MFGAFRNLYRVINNEKGSNISCSILIMVANSRMKNSKDTVMRMVFTMLSPCHELQNKMG